MSRMKLFVVSHPRRFESFQIENLSVAEAQRITDAISSVKSMEKGDLVFVLRRLEIPSAEIKLDHGAVQQAAEFSVTWMTRWNGDRWEDVLGAAITKGIR